MAAAARFRARSTPAGSGGSGVPELPEVEALAGFLRARAVGQSVSRVDVAALNVLKTVAPPLSALAGRPVTGAARHGKFLDLEIDGLHLVTHFSRAGWLSWRPTLPAAPPRPGKGPLAARVHLSGGGGFDLTEAGTQKRMSLYLVEGERDVPGIARLGPDPLGAEFTVAVLTRVLTAAGRSRLKGVLTDQALVAGIGNAYSDEILWAARCSPYTSAAALDPGGIAALHQAIVATLRGATERAVAVGAAELKAEKRSGLAVHGRAGQQCPRCGSTIREVSFAERSLQYCPVCQTGGRVLADRRLSRLLR